MDTESASFSLKLQFENPLIEVNPYAATADPNALRYANTHAAPAVNPSTSRLSASVNPVFMQEHEGSLMPYTTQSAQIGQQITQIILTSPDPLTLLARTAKALGEIFQVDFCLIVPLTQQGDRIIAHPLATTEQALWCADDVPNLPLTAQAQLLEHPILQENWENPQPQAISDLHDSQARSTPECGEEVLPLRAILSIDTRFQSSVNGVIVLGRSQPHEWTPSEKDLLAIASESVAVAISQVQLTCQVHRCARSQSLLHQLSLAIRRTNNLDEILQIAIASTAPTLHVDRGFILLLTYTISQSQSRPSRHLPQAKVSIVSEWIEETAQQSTPATDSVPYLLNQSFWLSESLLYQQAFRDAPAPLIVSDSRNSSVIDLRTDSLSIFNWETMPALLVVPLLGTPCNPSGATNVLGFLVLQHRQPRLWHPDEIEFVEGVSAQISATIVQNQTLRQVQSQVEERTAQLQHSLEIQEKLYKKTRQQIDQLQQLNQLKEEFMSTMSHELRTPLTAMSLAIRMLRQPTLSPERSKKYLEILEQECNKEIELISDLLSLQQLEADQASIHPQAIDLMELIDSLARSFEQKWAEKQLTLTVERSVRSPSAHKTQSLMFNTDPDSLNRILLELLTNAGKYSDPGTTVRLQVTHQAQSSGKGIVLTLSNVGAGISPADLAHIFDKFRRGQGVTQQAIQGTGLGLALVKCLVQHLNGTIEVSSCPLEDSQRSLISFTLTLPQLQQQP